MVRIEEVDLEKVMVADIVPEERHAFDEAYMRHEGRITCVRGVRVPAVGERKSMVDRMSKRRNVALKLLGRPRLRVGNV